MLASRFLAAALIAACPALVCAQTPAAIDRARAAIQQGDLTAGERALAEVDPGTTDPNDLDFLKGTLAAAKGDTAGAIARFKAVLARDGSLNRVRLDLARAYFTAGDDAAAEHHFRAAMAQGVPPEVQANIDRFLAEIARRKRWTVTLQLALAPDSNINAATTAQNITLFGLPFQLDPAARKRSGVGLSSGLDASYQWNLTGDTKLKAGGGYSGTEYADDAFSDRAVSFYAGPRFLLSPGREVSVFVTAARRWFGGRTLSTAAGGRVEGEIRLSPRTALGGAVFGQAVDYDAPYQSYSGPVFGAAGVLTYALNAHSFVRGTAGVTREQTDLAAFRDMQYSFGGGYYRDALPYAFAAYLEVRGTLIPYGAPLAAFGEARRDVEMNYRLSLSNTRIDVVGFTPVITYQHVNHYSNIALYAYARDRIELGVTRNF